MAPSVINQKYQLVTLHMAEFRVFWAGIDPNEILNLGRHSREVAPILMEERRLGLLADLSPLRY